MMGGDQLSSQPADDAIHESAPRYLPRGLDFEFDVGNEERHRVHFSFDKFWGRLKIDVDDRKVLRGFRFWTLNTTKRYGFEIGGSERHEVVIEMHWKPFMAGLRPQVCHVFVDGNLIAMYAG